MFGELQKLFDRNFAIGFFLPSFLGIVSTALVLNQHVFRVDIFALEQFRLLAFTTVLGVLGLIGGIILLALNRVLYRILEGYGAYNPIRLFGWIERRRYRDLWNEVGRLGSEYWDSVNAKQEFPPTLNERRDKLLRRLAVEFPDQEQYLLPTRFGNALRSFEAFPRIMYGLDSIPGWGRLLAVVPAQYTDLLAGAKAHVDLWVNLGLVSILLEIEYFGLMIALRTSPNWWMLGTWIVLAIIAPFAATSSAYEWGDFVKSAFDVFAPRLREELGIEQPRDREEEFAQWEAYSRALIYRSREYLPDLKRANKQQPAPSSLPSRRRNRAGRKN